MRYTVEDVAGNVLNSTDVRTDALAYAKEYANLTKREFTAWDTHTNKGVVYGSNGDPVRNTIR